MEHLCTKYRDRSVEFFLVHVREPHPNGKGYIDPDADPLLTPVFEQQYPQPTTFEERLEHARQFRQLFQSQRTILVDPIDNPTFARYGYLSNMSYVISKRGLVMYRCNWTRPSEIEEVVKNLLEYEDVRQLEGKARKLQSERIIYATQEDLESPRL